MPEVSTYQGGYELATIPRRPGLYAWYYRPQHIEHADLTARLGSFLEAPGDFSASLHTRYGVRWTARATPVATFSDNQASAADEMRRAVSGSEQFFEAFFTSAAVLHFSRPLYIGIAKNLYDRIYNGHYQELQELHEPTSSVSRFLNAHPGLGAAAALEQLDADHSFAVEARVRGIAVRDLLVCVYLIDQPPTSLMPAQDRADDRAHRRALERVLQLVADPVCGRR